MGSTQIHIGRVSTEFFVGEGGGGDLVMLATLGACSIGITHLDIWGHVL